MNRSPSAYLNNPSAERNKYKYNVDKEMTLLKFVDDDWGPVGSFNWFATHGTSMGRTNSLISGDNKGAAARFMEDWFNQNSAETQVSNVTKVSKLPRRISNIIPIHKKRKIFIYSTAHAIILGIKNTKDCLKLLQFMIMKWVVCRIFF